MSVSTATRHALFEASMWLAGAAIMVAAIVYFDELKTLLGLRYDHIRTTIASRGKAQTPINRSTPAHRASVQSTPSGNTVELIAAGNGHFFADSRINGSTIRVMVDTGATMVALSHRDAQNAGIHLNQSDYQHKVSTANGHARIAIINLDSVSIGDITVYNVRAAVSEPGALQTTLLGMSFLSKLRRTEIRQGRLILEN